MLILTRKPGESLYIGDDVIVTLVEIKGNQVRLGIEAPSHVRIYRKEIYLQILEENKKAAETPTESGLDGLPPSWTGGDDKEAPKTKKLVASSVRPVKLSRPPGSAEIAPLAAGKPADAGAPGGPNVVVKRRKGKTTDE